MFTFIASAQTTITVYVSDEFDNMEETVDDEFEDDGTTVKHAAGYMDNGSSDLELCTELENLRQLVGVGFRNVQIPIGATITNAYVQFTSDSDEDTPVSIEIWGVAEANTVLPIVHEVDKGLSLRLKTTANIAAWVPEAWVSGDRGAAQQTPDLSAIIAEIIAMDGWVPGNNLMIQFTAQNLEKAHREGVPYGAALGAGNAENAPALVVTYTEGGGDTGPGGTVTIPIIASADDAEEIGADVGDGGVIGEVDLTSSDLELVFDKEMQWVGMLFRDVQIGTGTDITNVNDAYVQFVVDEIKEGVTDAAITLEVYGVLEANTADITETPFNISSRPSTTAKVSWTPGASVAVGDAGVNEQTPDLSAIINEIIALDGWASGNNIMIVVTGDATQSVDMNREVNAFDDDEGQAGAASLVITQWPSAVNEVSEFSSGIYPNPTDGRLIITNSSTGEFGYSIYSITGKQVVSRQNIFGSETEIDMSGFAKGMYLVNVRTGNKSEVHKLIVK